MNWQLPNHATRNRFELIFRSLAIEISEVAESGCFRQLVNVGANRHERSSCFFGPLLLTQAVACFRPVSFCRVQSLSEK